jgi:outer membrane protein TolC
MRLLIVLVLLSGCAVGPDYRKPEPLEGAAPPAQFKELAGWRVAAPSDALPKGSWWGVFGDAELDALMRRVDVSNHTIRVSEARVRQARAAVDQARAALFPAINASASATRSKSPSLSNQPSFATGAVSNYNLALSAGWELDLWGRVRP